MKWYNIERGDPINVSQHRLLVTFPLDPIQLSLLVLQEEAATACLTVSYGTLSFLSFLCFQ